MRLFVALEIDDPARAALHALQRRIARAVGSASGLRLTRTDQMHLTLVFIGEVDPPRAAVIEDALRPPLDEAPYELVLGGVGMFPQRGAPRVLWAGVLAGGRETIAVHRQTAERLGRVEVTGEERTFHPHLTLGRWKSSRSADRRVVAAMGDTGEIARVRIAAATLYQSRLSPSGSEYTPLVRTAFAG